MFEKTSILNGYNLDGKICLGIDIHKKNLHMVHEKKCKNANSNHKVPTFWE